MFVFFLSSNLGKTQTSNIKYYIIRPCTYQLLAVDLPVQPVVHPKHPPVVGQLQSKVTFLLRQESATQIFPSQYVPHVARQAIEPIVVPRHHVTQRCVRWERSQRFLFIPHRRVLFGREEEKKIKQRVKSRERSTKTDSIFSATEGIGIIVWYCCYTVKYSKNCFDGTDSPSQYGGTCGGG